MTAYTMFGLPPGYRAHLERLLDKEAAKGFNDPEVVTARQEFEEALAAGEYPIPGLSDMDLQGLVDGIRNYPGVTRKRTISEVISFFPLIPNKNVLAAYGEDAAVIKFNDDVLLLAADGIMLTAARCRWKGSRRHIIPAPP